MGFYADKILPWCCDQAMSRRDLWPVRRELLAPVAGEVLEIGFGTGLNLPHYPTTLERLVTVDVSASMNRYAAERVAASEIAVELRVLDAEKLPFDDERFDFVVSTWTLCSIPDVDAALQEVRRVLKPNGRLLTVEHGLAPDRGVQRCQNLLNPAQKLFAGGCHLNRDMRAILTRSGLRLAIEQYYFPGHPRFVGYTTRGHGIKD